MRTNPLRVVIISPDRVLMEALAYRIKAEQDLEVSGLFASGEEGLRHIIQYDPHAAVVDINVPGCGPFTLAAELVKERKQTRVLLLSDNVTDVFLEQVAQLRLPGYATRDESIDALITGIYKVAMGGEFFSDTVVTRLRFDAPNNRYSLAADRGLMSLTPQQFEVFSYLAKGKSVKEVAGIMQLTHKAVASHKYRLMKKLEIHDRVELALLAIREGVLLP